MVKPRLSWIFALPACSHRLDLVVILDLARLSMLGEYQDRVANAIDMPVHAPALRDAAPDLVPSHTSTSRSKHP